MTETAPLRIPDYAGGSLPNLVAELEWRLTGSAISARLHPDLSVRIPEAASYVLLMIDGLGDHQLDHRMASSLAAARQGTLDAPFPTTTTVSLATVASGLPPSRHGVIGHFMLLEGHPHPVNVLRWVDSTGRPVPDRRPMIPSPNLWERLVSEGIEPVTVQPRGYSDTPLTRVLYRGCRFEGVDGMMDFVQAVVDLARVPGRLVFAYFPDVDISAHVHGFGSPAYAQALSGISAAWDHLSALLPAHVGMVGTADHGLVSIENAGKHRIRRRHHPDLVLYGDPRSLYVRGPSDRIAALGTEVPAAWYPYRQIESWWGQSGTPAEESALGPSPDGAFLADAGRVLLPGHMDRRMVGYHGGLDPREVRIPLLVAAAS